MLVHSYMSTSPSPSIVPSTQSVADAYGITGLSDGGKAIRKHVYPTTVFRRERIVPWPLLCQNVSSQLIQLAM